MKILIVWIVWKGGRLEISAMIVYLENIKHFIHVSLYSLSEDTPRILARDLHEYLLSRLITMTPEKISWKSTRKLTSDL